MEQEFVIISEWCEWCELQSQRLQFGVTHPKDCGPADLGAHVPTQQPHTRSIAAAANAIAIGGTLDRTPCNADEPNASIQHFPVINLPSRIHT